MASNTPRQDNLEKNLIINGNFDFWQRGTSISASVAGAPLYLADRFAVQNQLPSQAVTYAQSTDVPTLAQSNYQSRFGVIITNSATPSTIGAANFLIIKHRIEGQDYQAIHGRKARLQFWVKSSVIGVYGLSLNNANDTRNYIATYTITAANTWQKVIVDIGLDTTGTWAFDNTLGIQINFTLSAGASFQNSTVNTWIATESFTTSAQTQWATTASATFQLAQIMLIPQDFTQAGSALVDVPFARAGRSVGHELTMCQRYYESGFYSSYFPSGGTGYVGSTVPYAVEKRAIPTLNYSDGSSTSTKVSIISAGNGSQTANLAALIQTNLTRQFQLIYIGATTSFGLLYNWNSDAEL